HLRDAVKLLLPCQAFLRFVTLMRTGRGVPQRLRHFRYMDQYGDMLFPADERCPLIRFTKAWIIPTIYLKYFEPCSLVVPLKSLKHLRYIGFGGLNIVRH